LTTLRILGEVENFGRTAADDDCPTAQQEAKDTVRWVGGCTTADGAASFTGELLEVAAITAESVETTSTSDSWLATYSGSAFSEIEFAGSWHVLEAADLTWREDETSGLLRLNGTPDGFVDLALPFGISGSYDWTGDWGTKGLEVHTFEFDGLVRCRGAMTATIEMRQSGLCFNDLPDGGAIRLEANGHVAEFDFGGASDCSGCWPWTLDGVAQADPICVVPP